MSDRPEYTVTRSELLTVLAPVLHWYQPDDQPQRPMLDILRDVVSDLQSDRAAALDGAKDKRRLDFMNAHPCPTEIEGGSHDGLRCNTWAVAARTDDVREALDAWIFLEKMPESRK